MIHINLLPVREIQRRNKAKQQIILLAVALLIFLFFLSLFGFYQASRVTRLQKNNEKLQQEKQQYTKILNEIKRLEENKSILKTRIDIIKKLKESSSLTVHILDEVANLTPPNRMWLTALSQTGKDLRISGMALDNQTVAKYMDDLDKSPFIGNVNLVSSSMKIFAERNLKLFSVACTADTPESDNKIKN
jgi:type IV pilus assembly protein PilN